MNPFRITLFSSFGFIPVFLLSCMMTVPISGLAQKDSKGIMIRLAKIEVDSVYLQEYLQILNKEAKTSVLNEDGVICILPMMIDENPTSIRLIELYANRKAYEDHLKTPHFLAYKTSTLHMVKSLELIDMKAFDQEILLSIFEKMNTTLNKD